MDLVVIVEPSDGDYPGHMVVGQEGESSSRFFGFHLDPDSLPAENRAPEHWQDYLYRHKVLGEIQDESEYVSGIRQQKPGLIYEKRAICAVSIDSLMPPPAAWKHWAHYSFRPDDFHTDAVPCYNCVTWATMIANTLVPGFITPVRQGQIKLIVRQLKDAGRKKGAKDG
jgi:hypothetical protein